MSTTPRHPPGKPIKVGSWRRDFASLEQRRMEAARMFACGASPAEVARAFEASAQAASVWYRRWHQSGVSALHAAGRAGPAAAHSCHRRPWRRSTAPRPRA